MKTKKKSWTTFQTMMQFVHIQSADGRWNLISSNWYWCIDLPHLTMRRAVSLLAADTHNLMALYETFVITNTENTIKFRSAALPTATIDGDQMHSNALNNGKRNRNVCVHYIWSFYFRLRYENFHLTQGHTPSWIHHCQWHCSSLSLPN